MSEFCIICAAPRSGTTFLGDAVTTAYEAAWPEEIFHEFHAGPGLDYRVAEDPQERANFFSFRAEAASQRPEFMYPDRASRERLFDAYLDNLRTLFPGSDRFLLDIKYNSWHHLDGFWRMPVDPPGLIDLLQAKDIPVVHLVRNCFAQYCSFRIAVESNIWATRQGDPVEPRTIEVDLEDCERHMTDVAATRKLFDRWLYGGTVHHLEYETLLHGDRFAGEVSDVFTRVFGKEPAGELHTEYTKTLPPLSRVVENSEAVLDYFEGTEFETAVRAALTNTTGERPRSASS